MSIRISQLNDNSVSVYQARYATSVVDKYIDTATVNKSANFYKTTFTYDMTFTKDDVSICDEQVENLSREFNIHYRSRIG